jgi:predicted transglutaminase-like cysteine proteinase
MSIAKIVGFTQLRVKNCFIYESDLKNYGKNEDWRSHADAVRKQEYFKDDCDGFALTCAELLMEQGISKQKIKLIYCKTETGEQHLVCGVDVNDPDFGETIYICDNRNETMRSIQEMPKYEWQKFMRMSEIGTWVDM